MLPRIIAIIFIYACTAAAWVVLGGTVHHRTYNQDEILRSQVGQLWGTVQRQTAPLVFYQTRTTKTVERAKDGEKITETVDEVTDHFVPLESSRIQVNLDLDHRRKGLLWYATYEVKFKAKYVISNPTNEARTMYFSFTFPDQDAVYDDFRFSVNGRNLDNIPLSSGRLTEGVVLEPGARAVYEISYVSRGLDEWWYSFGHQVSQVKDFKLEMSTDFTDIDFPQNSMSPTDKITSSQGWTLVWEYTNLLTGVKIAMSMPQKLNPGPWVGQVSFAAPISLFLFFFLLFMFTTLKGIKIHPMNYFFIGAAFFSFHLLLAYLVDHVSIHTAFFISSAVSIFLVTTYMRLVVGARFAFLEVGLSQFVYLVLFSYTFFFQGYTGLAITILAVVTLFIVMQMTGRIDWSEVFRKNKGQGNKGAAPEFSFD